MGAEDRLPVLEPLLDEGDEEAVALLDVGDEPRPDLGPAPHPRQRQEAHAGGDNDPEVVQVGPRTGRMPSERRPLRDG